jgi:hypothetical protein
LGTANSAPKPFKKNIMIFYNFTQRKKGVSLYFNAVLFMLLIMVSACDQYKDEIVDPPPLQLDYMKIEERKNEGLLYLYGYFGDSTSQATVWINDLAITGELSFANIVSWQPYFIKCIIPPAGIKDGAGKVYVANKGSKSNVRTLNQWKGEIVFQRPDQGTIERTMWMDVYLRADADPHKNSTYYFTPVSGFASSSKLRYSIGGQGRSNYSSSCDVKMTASLTSANGVILPSFPFGDRASEDVYFQSALTFTNGRFEVTDIDVFKKDVSTKTMLVETCGPPSSYSVPYSLYGLPYELQQFNLEFEPNSKVIKAGQIVQKVSTEMGLVWDNGNVPFYDCFVSWKRMVPEY